MNRVGRLAELNELVDIAVKIEELINIHCDTQSCCDVEDKSTITNAILEALTGLDSDLVEKYNMYEKYYNDTHRL